MKKYNVAILGATGAVGQEFLNLIEERKFPFANLKLLASKRSAGKKIQFMGKEYTVELKIPLTTWILLFLQAAPSVRLLVLLLPRLVLWLLIIPVPSVWTLRCLLLFQR